MAAAPRTSVTQNLILLATSVLIGLLVAEGLIRLFVSVRNVGPTFSEYDPVYGKRLKKNFRCVRETPEFTMQFSTNSYGFRGEEPTSFPERPILFLGDSFTSGYGVDNGQEFPALVHRQLLADPVSSETPVVNAGSGNIGNGYWVKFLQNDAPLYDPRLVVLEFCGNDYVDNITDGLFYLDSQGNLISTPGQAPRETGRWAQKIIETIPGLTSSHLVSLLRQISSDKFPESFSDTLSVDSPPDSCEKLTLAIAAAAFEECRRNSWPTLVMTVELQGRRLAQITSLARSFDYPTLNIPTKTERPDLYYSVDGHWTAAGHRFVASQVYEAIQHQLGGSLKIPRTLSEAVFQEKGFASRVD